MNQRHSCCFLRSAQCSQDVKTLCNVLQVGGQLQQNRAKGPGWRIHVEIFTYSIFSLYTKKYLYISQDGLVFRSNVMFCSLIAARTKDASSCSMCRFRSSSSDPAHWWGDERACSRMTPISTSLDGKDHLSMPRNATPHRDDKTSIFLLTNLLVSIHPREYKASKHTISPDNHDSRTQSTPHPRC